MNDEETPAVFKTLGTAIMLGYLGVGLFGMAMVFGPLIAAAATWLAAHLGVPLFVVMVMLEAKVKGKDPVKAGLKTGANSTVVNLVADKIEEWLS